MNENQTIQTQGSKTTTLFALLAILISAGVFKEELKWLKIGIIPGSLYDIFIIAVLTLSSILMLYLLIDLRPGTILEKRFVKISSYTKSLLDNLLLFLILIIVVLILAVIIVNILQFNAIWQIILYSLPVLAVALGVNFGLRDNKRYKEKIAALPEDERELVMRIDGLSDATAMIAAATNHKNAEYIEQELSSLKEQLELIRAKKRSE